MSVIFTAQRSRRHRRRCLGGRWWMAAGVAPWAAYEPKGAGSFAGSLIDLTGNGRDAGDPGGGGTPTWDAVNGWTFDGVGNYLTTTFVPAADQTQSMFVQYTNLDGANDYFIGMLDAFARDFAIAPNNGGAQVVYHNGDLVFQAPTGAASGNLGIAGNQGYRNGVADGGAIGAWAGATATAVYIGCYNNGGVAGGFCPVRMQAVIFYDVTLTSDQVTALCAEMAAV